MISRLLSIIIYAVAVAYVGILHFIFGIHIAKYINDMIIPDYSVDEKKTKTWEILFFHITMILILYEVIAYIVANIPFPLDGVMGHDHTLVVEGSIVLSMVVLHSQKKFERRIRAVSSH